MSKKSNQSNEEVQKNGTELKLVSLRKTNEENQSLYCRICLLTKGSKISQSEQFIAPCTCSGSLKYCHVQCLQTWIKTSLKSRKKKKVNEGNGEYSLPCEICTTPMIFGMKIQLQKAKCAEIRQNIQKNKGLFSLMMIIFVFLIGCIIASISIAALKETSQKDDGLKEIMIAFGATGGVGIVIFFFVMWKHFLSRKVLSVDLKQYAKDIKKKQKNLFTQANS